jgi:glucose/arabinose dehydrogenase
VGLEFTGGKLYATNMGADHLGDDAPNDTMFILDSANGAEPGEPKNYGWPYCYFKDGQAVTDPLLAHSTKNINCAQVPQPFAVFAAHGSPLGLAYFDGTAQDPALRGYFLVALHGASKRSLQRGYRVVRVSAQSPPQDFITGFLRHGVIYGRPCGILRTGADSFLLSDDHSGVIYFVHRRTD